MSDNNKLFVGNLDWEVDSDELSSVFSKVGTVIDVVVLKDRETHKSRGFGFVTFDDAHDCDVAIKELDNLELRGRKIRVSKAKPRT